MERAAEQGQPCGRAILRADELVVLLDRKSRCYLRRLRPGGRISVRGGSLQSDHLIGIAEGSVVYTSTREPLLLLRPTLAQLVPNLPRRAQVIYPKDIGPILLWGDIFPGARVVEIGTGPGALTIALLRAVGREGKVVSYEVRDDFAAMAEQNVRRFLGDTPQWTLRRADAFAGIAEREVDRFLTDIPEPWRLLGQAAESLRPGGVFVGFLPTVLQVKELVDGLECHGSFAAIETIETLVRHWHVKGPSVRPEHRMVAHTGFIVVARRRAAIGPSATDPPTRSREGQVR